MSYSKCYIRTTQDQLRRKKKIIAKNITRHTGLSATTISAIEAGKPGSVLSLIKYMQYTNIEFKHFEWFDQKGKKLKFPGII